MFKINLDKLKVLAQKKSIQIVLERKDVMAIYLAGSIARELLFLVPRDSNVYQYSDVDLTVIISGKNKDIFSYKSSPELPLTGYCINYYSLDAFAKKREIEWFNFDKLSNWIPEAIPLYDPKNILGSLRVKYGTWNSSIQMRVTEHLYGFAKLDLSDAFCFFDKKEYLLSLWALRQAQAKLVEKTIVEQGKFRYSPKVNIQLINKAIKDLILKTEQVHQIMKDQSQQKYLSSLLKQTEKLLKKGKLS